MLNARLQINVSLAIQVTLRWIAAVLAFLFRR